MAQFVLIVNGITGAQLQKAMEVVTKSKGKVSFVPQSSNAHGVQVASMSATKANPNAEDSYEHVRLEWTHDASDLGKEVIQALAGN